LKRYFLFSLLPVSLLAAAAPAPDERIVLKECPGRATTEANCTMCHSLDYIGMNSPFLEREGWEKVVDKMVKVMGAPVDQKDLPEIIGYLTSCYGRK
jgi:hypothetical protein